MIVSQGIQILADRLTPLLQLVDGFMESLTDEDYELVKETLIE